MTVRISELNSLSTDLSQIDALPVVDLSAGETKQVSVGDLINIGISGAPSSFIDIAKIDQSSATKLSYLALDNTGVASGVYGDADTVARFVVNNQGLVTSVSGVAIAITASSVTGLAPVATSGTYASLSGLPTLGTMAAQDAGSIVVSGGTISGVAIVTGNITVSGGSISGITDLAVADGGTGSSTASGARTNLGLSIGSDVQAYSSVLSGVAAQFTNADEIIYASASGVVSSTPFTSFARSIVSGSTASGVRATLELGSIATQDAGNVAISGGTISGVAIVTGSVTVSGGSISGITDLAIADGGTGASTASGARANLGLVIGTDVQAYSSVLSGVAEQFKNADEIIYASASGIVSSTPFTSFARSIASGSTASDVRTIIGLGSIATQDAGNVVISGGTISGITLDASGVTISGGVITDITDLAIADGGTGASTASGARTNLGLVIGTNVQGYSSVLSGVAAQFTNADEIIYASASGVVSSAPFSSFGRSIVSGATASGVRNTLGLGTLAIQEASNIAVLGGTLSGVTLITSNAIIDGGSISGITDLAVADGGTGASTASGARTNLGLVIGTDVQAYSVSLDSLAGATTASGQIIYSTASGQYTNAPVTTLGLSLLAESAASGVRAITGLGTLATQDASSVAISGGTISGITDLAIDDGGTGASTASDARTNLGLVIGTDVQAYKAGLESIGDLSTSADQLLYASGTNAYATTPFPLYARSLIASGNSAPDTRNALGLGALATKSSVASGDVASGAIFGTAIASGSIIAGSYGAESIGSADIQAGGIATANIADSGITAIKIANNTTTIVDAGAPVVNGTFIGQRYFDSIGKFDYAWNGSAWDRQSAISSINFIESDYLSFAVAYPDNVSTDITVSFDSQTANTFFAGPASGNAASPSFRSMVSSDLPLATSGATGAVRPGAGLTVDATGVLNHSNSAAAGTYGGPVTIDAEGHVVSAQASLQASDIPNLDASKITTGTFGSEFLAPNSVTASQLADYGIAQVSESAPVPEFAGQWWINPNDRSAYIWVGEVVPIPNGYWLNLGYGSPTQINLRFGGTYNASGNVVESINSYGIEAGLTVGQSLSAPNTSNNGIYLIVTASGVGTAPAPTESLAIGNWVLSQGVGASWTRVALSSAVTGVSDNDVLVDGSALIPTASGVASQEDLNELVWGRVQIANTTTAGIVRASTEVVVASGTGIMSIGTIDDGSY